MLKWRWKFGILLNSAGAISQFRAPGIGSVSKSLHMDVSLPQLSSL